MKLTFTQLKELKEIANDDFADVRAVIEELQDGNDDSTYTGETIRIIHKDVIKEVMTEELGNDTYILGCFNAYFIGNLATLNLETDFIEDLQKAEAFEAIGELIVRTPGALEELVDDYIYSDGYGHHFAHYDHNEHEVGEFLVFKIN